MDKAEFTFTELKLEAYQCKPFLGQAMECTDADAEGDPTDLTYQPLRELFKGKQGS